MNNTFNINRFGKILKHDGLNYFPNIILALAILWAIPVVIYLFTSLMPTEETNKVFDACGRINIIDALTKIAVIIAPVRLYKYCNDSRKGIGYAMLPASTLEKFLSMVFYCALVTPIIYIAGALAIDSILALFNGPYEGFAISEFFDTMSQIKHQLINSGVRWEEDLPVYAEYDKLITPFIRIMLSIFGILSLSSIFMFGNMIFKKHKTGKMIGILILLFIIFMIIFINYVANNEEYFEQKLTNIDGENFVKLIIYYFTRGLLVVQIVVSALMLFGVYRKIKTQKY